MHGHRHGPRDSHRDGAAGYNRAFAIGVGLNTAFVVLEALFGFLGGSLALVADAGHNLSDVGSLLLAWGASLLAGRRPTVRRTYGFRRATILAALTSAVLLLVALGGIGWEAVERLRDPQEIRATMVVVVAAAGVLVNGVTALLFLRGSREDLNLKGAFLHMTADAMVSFGVLAAGVVIAATDWTWIDPATSLVVVLVVLVGTWGLFRDSLNLAMDAVPPGIDPEQVRAFLLGRPGVEDVHDLHIWGLSTTQAALTAHLVIPERPLRDDFLKRVTGELERRFGIDHSTLQIERGDAGQPCEQAAAEECR